MFADRPKDFGIFFVGSHPSGQAIKNAVGSGDAVTLHVGNEKALVRGVVNLGAGRFRGKIYGFEPSGAVSYGTMRIDQEVEFLERQVFGCQSP